MCLFCRVGSSFGIHSLEGGGGVGAPRGSLEVPSFTLPPQIVFMCVYASVCVCVPSFCTRVNVSAQRLYSSDRGGGSGAGGRGVGGGGGAFHAATRVDVGRPAGPLRSEAGRRPKHEKHTANT